MFASFYSPLFNLTPLASRISPRHVRFGSVGGRSGIPSTKPFKVGVRVTPTDFGGDPTGRKDSWDALNSALNHCLNQSALSPNGYFPGEDSTPSFGQCRGAGVSARAFTLLQPVTNT